MLNLLLLGAKFLFLLVLYMFVLMVIRSAIKDVHRAATRPVPGVTPLDEWGAPPPHPLAAAGGDPGAGRALAEGADWVVQVVSSAELPRGQAYRVPRAGLVIGRSNAADLHLRDTFVSSQHARLSVTDQGLLLEDLQSTNGTLVNGAEASETWLRPGDEIAIGDTVLKAEVR